MNWIDKLEKKFGRYAIPNLMHYIIILYAVGYVILLFAPDMYYSYLSLDASAILHGQIWRMVTFLIYPPNASLIWFMLVLYLYYSIGLRLEAQWGTFRFNLYFFSGMLFHVAAALLLYVFTGMLLPMSVWYLNMSLFFAFAALYPDVQFLMFFVIPVKVKYLALIDALYFIYPIIQAFLPAYGGNVLMGSFYKAAALESVVSLLNFLIFFFGSRNMRPYTPRQRRRKKEFQQNIRRAQRPVQNYANGAKHMCAICKRTELDDPNLEFRYCSKCNGNYEYCQDHLFTHTHVK